MTDGIEERQVDRDHLKGKREEHGFKQQGIAQRPLLEKRVLIGMNGQHIAHLG